MCPLPAWAPSRVFTLSKRYLTQSPLPLSVRTHSTPTGARPTPGSQRLKAKLSRLPLLLPKRFTQADQLCLRIWSIGYEFSHTGVPWRIPSPLGHRPPMLLFRLCNGPRCQAATRRLLRFIVTTTCHLAVRDAHSFWATGFLLESQGSSSSKSLRTLGTGPASQRARSTFTFRAVRKTHPTVPAAGSCCLLANRPYQACSVLPRDPPTASQSSTGACTERITATRSHVPCGGHWLPPSRAASSSSARWLSC